MRSELAWSNPRSQFPIGLHKIGMVCIKMEQ